MRLPAVLLLLALIHAPETLPALTLQFHQPAAEIERRLATEPFEIVGMQDNRWQGDRTQRTALRFRDGTTLHVKWARAAEGGFTLNNQPQYEVASYRLQKLFLEPGDWVVPPTFLRVLPLSLYRRLEPGIAPTFDGTRSVLVALQYWIEDVAPMDSVDGARLHDPAYARRLGNLNLLTHLIRHADSNHGNVLIATDGEPYMFAVDNGVAFNSPDSPRGTYWKELRVHRLPAAPVERLRSLTRDRLHDELAVVAQYEIDDDGRLAPVDPAPKLNPNRGVDRVGRTVQIGLSDREIDDIWARIQTLLRRVDAGELTTF